MILNESLKKTVAEAVASKEFKNEDPKKNNVNKIITCVILNNTLKKIFKYSPKQEGQLSSLANSYATTFKIEAESMENKYISYKKIKYLIETLKVNSFLQLSEKNINEIYSLYENKSLIVPFNRVLFSQNMYQRDDLNDNEKTRLSKIHELIIVPIVEYFMTNSGITEDDVFVEDINIDKAGGEINISIKNIYGGQIYTLIKRDFVNIKKYLYSFELLENDIVKLTIK